MARADDVPGPAGARLSEGRARVARLARQPQRTLRLHVRRSLPCDAGADRGRRLRHLRRPAAPVRADEAADRRRRPAPVKAVVVGGGLAGCAAALELLKAGHEVTLLEARPTLGGAVQTLPEREGDPRPPPDNGQHIALGCFTEYLGFLRDIDQAGSLRRSRLSLPVIDELGRTAVIRPSALSILRYSHLFPTYRLRVLRTLLRLRRVDPRSCDEETFCAFLMLRLGESEPAIRSFWDVFIRPALNLPSDEASAALGVMTVQTALLSGRHRASDLLLPTAPLGDMHGVAAGRKLESLGARVKTPLESARLLDEPDPELGKSPIVSVHLWFDRELLPFPLAALLNSDAHWIFDRGRLTGHRPERGQYLTVVSSGVPELMDVRGRELVELMRDELTGRLGDARLLWSRVSREPAATFEGRPGTAARRRGPRTSRFNVVRAGAWTDTGWPATMESAVRSGRTAARMLSDVATKLAA
ncbi:MAG: FAD-dependent oxidoreductase [Actinobacteria bacterium]|nr:MAG: FAD-dependent oxidoreductase [Actinomycetota bacterium]